MSALFSETPTGSVDGNNVVFTASHTVAHLVTVTVDGAPYTGQVGVSGAQLTLADAPTTNIYIQYFIGAVPTNVTPLSVQEAYDLLLRDLEYVTDTGMISDTLFLDWINMVDGGYYREMVRENPLRFFAEESFVVTDTEREITIATLETLYAEGCGVFWADTGTPLRAVLPGSASTGYYLAGTRIVCTGAERGRVVIRYVPTRPRITSMDGVTLLPVEHAELALRALRKLFDMWDRQESLQQSEAYFRELFAAAVEYAGRKPVLPLSTRSVLPF